MFETESATVLQSDMTKASVHKTDTHISNFIEVRAKAKSIANFWE